MARNAEKAMTTLARWRAAQLGETEKHKKRRPYLASECKSLYACEKWRMQIIREIAKKVAQIQNAGLGEFRIRDLNDEINKLLREKRHWEDQIKELGGPDYQRVGPRMLDHEGKEVPGNRGYKYFGAAKELPGKEAPMILNFLNSDEENTVDTDTIQDGSQKRFVAHVPVPSQQDIEQALLKRRKLELMAKYGIGDETPS
nr:pre-mRNA-splicing factor ISY1 homolog [Leptinotarsa decemlineata]